MERRIFLPILWTALLVALGPTAAPAQQAHDHAKLGTVKFPVSCRPEVQPSFNAAVALLHHMMYEQARAEFTAVTERDPKCAMGYWGVAMTLFQPLWPGQPNAEAMQQGLALVKRAMAMHPLTERERSFLGALYSFYGEPADRDYRARLATWAEGQEAVYRAHPDDPEAASFHALSLLAVAPPTDKTLAKQQRAAEVLARIRTRLPSHPGAVHYAIHAHDNVTLGARGADVARSYDDIAPTVPHALHMPTHIFVRLGQWPDVIDWNRRSADAALRFPVAGAVSVHFGHALDYLVYAHLQRGEDSAAKAAVEEMRRQEKLQGAFVNAYALAAIPARYAVERRQWSEAAQLEPRMPASLPWDQAPGAEAITHFARGLGAAHTGDLAGARRSLARLDTLKAAAAKSDKYWVDQIEVQRLAVEGWMAQREGRADEARRLLTASAALEASTEKHPVTPGAIVPAHELLGDLLLAQGRAAEALQAYETSLAAAPRRFNSLQGATLAAEQSGNRQKVAAYRQELNEMTRDVHAAGERLRRHRDAVRGN